MRAARDGSPFARAALMSIKAEAAEGGPVAAARRRALNHWHSARREGLTAQKAADVVGIPRSTLFSWEKLRRQNRLEPQSRRPTATVERVEYGENTALLDRMVRAVVDEVAPERVILFGSRARGDAKADSDYDLIVVESEAFSEKRSRHDEEARLYRALAGIGASTDILVYCQDEVDFWRGSLNHILARALQEGKVLYERSPARPCSMSDPQQDRELLQARELLDAAGRDLSALRGMNDADVFADEIYGFHVQQAAEKSFKAWLALLGEKYPTIHDLADLLEPLKERDLEAAGFEEFTEFTRFAVRFRYAGVEPRANPLDRGAILPRVEALHEHVQRLIENAQ